MTKLEQQKLSASSDIQYFNGLINLLDPNSEIDQPIIEFYQRQIVKIKLKNY